jgi:HSP20 family molecular chaperone IbpA
MHSTLLTMNPTTASRQPATGLPEADYRHPHYECLDLPRALRISVMVPGVDPEGVEISSRGPDLLLVARKRRVVRVNWQALHLENVQRDYRLSLRLGRDFDLSSLRATLRGGVLVILVPKVSGPYAAEPARARRVA